MNNKNKQVLAIIDFVLSKYMYANVFVFYSFMKSFKIFMRFKLPTYIIVIYGLTVLFYKMFDFKNQFGYIEEILPGILILLSSIISILLSKVYNYENIKVLIVFSICLLVLLPENKKKNNQNIYKELYYFCLLVSMLFLIYTLISFFYYLNNSSISRPIGMLEELTYFAQSIVACIGASVYCIIFTNSKVIKIIEIINFIFQSFVLFLTLQRGSLYAYIIGIMTLAVFYTKNKNEFKINIKKELVIFSLLFIILLIIYLLFSKRISFELFQNRINFNLNLREYIYAFGFSALIYHNNYIFGTSRGGIYKSWSSYLSEFYNEWKEPYENYSIVNGCINQAAIHSTVLEQLFVHGILGLISLMYFYFKIIYNLYLLFIESNISKNRIALFSASLFLIGVPLLDSFVNRTLLFDIVYPQNLCFFVFTGALFRLLKKTGLVVY